MARSDAFCQCVRGGTNWNSTSCVKRKVLKFEGTLLSRICSVGLSPANKSLLYTRLDTSKRDAPVLFLIGSAKIAFGLYA